MHIQLNFLNQFTVCFNKLSNNCLKQFYLTFPMFSPCEITFSTKSTGTPDKWDEDDVEKSIWCYCHKIKKVTCSKHKRFKYLFKTENWKLTVTIGKLLLISQDYICFSAGKLLMRLKKIKSLGFLCILRV